jgi:hypothetical protein
MLVILLMKASRMRQQHTGWRTQAFPVESSLMTIPSRKVDAAVGDQIMPERRDVPQLNAFSVHGSARIAEASDAARCTRNWIIVANVAVWILIILAVRMIFF